MMKLFGDMATCCAAARHRNSPAHRLGGGDHQRVRGGIKFARGVLGQVTGEPPGPRAIVHDPACGCVNLGHRLHHRHEIERLEAECGFRLFGRRPRPLSLTREGEALLPVVRNAVQAIGDAVEHLRPGPAPGRLKVTTTNAFAARWLLPRLPRWRALHPQVRLEILGTDAVADLAAGEADAAIRYGRAAPTGPLLESVTLARDEFVVAAAPALVAGLALPLAPDVLAGLPLIESGWPVTDLDAPTWQRLEQCWPARTFNPGLARRVALSFVEELHAIEAAIAGQGAAICSDILVGPELLSGRLVVICDVRLPGYGFHGVFRRDSARASLARLFLRWMETELQVSPALARAAHSNGGTAEAAPPP